ncbi:MAG: type I secretion system permease/ATPase [Mesorhizobium sp.]|nr:MAG: type I secretion system permease/ATPase [Mesorhizobium sp.]
MTGVGPLRTLRQQVRKPICALALFSCVVNLLLMTGPLFMLQVYDRVLSSGSVQTLVALVILVVVLFAFMGTLDAMRSRVLARLAGRLDEILRGPVFSAVQSDAWRGAGNAGPSIRDLEAIRNWISGPGPAMFFDAPFVPLYIGVIFLLHIWLGWFAVGAASVLACFAVANEWLTRGPQLAASTAAESAQRLAEESRRQAAPAVALGMESNLRSLWELRVEEAVLLSNGLSDRLGTLSAMSKATRLLSQSGVLAIGAYLAIGQEISGGVMVAASILLARALSPIEQAIVHWRSVLVVVRSSRRVAQLLNATQVTASDPMELPPLNGTVSVSDVVCVASSRKEPLLAGISFKVNPGDGLGIIGPSGAGKTTLAHAILGIAPLVRGEIRISGSTHDQWNRDILGRQLGYLPQDAVLFPGSVARNISRFEPNADAKAVLHAAKLAGVHELILSFSNGYGTLVGQGGVALSAGERQRIALARALYGDPALVVLDEPNSNLDAEGDQALSEAIKATRDRGATIIVIAHRPSAINAVNMLLYLRSGKQVAFGPKDEVLRQVTRAVVPEPHQGNNVTVMRAGNE